MKISPSMISAEMSWEPGTFGAMIRGAVSEAGAWTFHPAGYKEVTGRDPQAAHDETLRKLHSGKA